MLPLCAVKFTYRNNTKHKGSRNYFFPMFVLQLGMLMKCKKKNELFNFNSSYVSAEKFAHFHVRSRAHSSKVNRQLTRLICARGIPSWWGIRGIASMARSVFLDVSLSLSRHQLTYNLYRLRNASTDIVEKHVIWYFPSICTLEDSTFFSRPSPTFQWFGQALLLLRSIERTTNSFL